MFQFFVSQPEVLKVLVRGDTKASVLLHGGIQADLRVVSNAEFAPALMYFTGSKEHNIIMRQRAIARGLRLNEYGLFRSKEETRDPKLLMPCKTEEDIFRELGLNYVPPEMREDAGEFALAEKEPVPRLVEWTDLKGSLHNHSTWSDGHQRPEDSGRRREHFRAWQGHDLSYTERSSTITVGEGLLCWAALRLVGMPLDRASRDVP